MDTRRRHLVGATAAMAALALSGCGGGDGSAAPPDDDDGQGLLSAPTLLGVPTAVAPLASLDLPIENYDPGSTYTLESDLGGGVVIDMMPLPESPGVFRFHAPVAPLNAQRELGDGVLKLRLQRTRDGRTSGVTEYILAQTAPTSMSPLGIPTLALMGATQSMVLSSLANIGVLGSKLPSGLPLGDVASSANLLHALFGDMAASITTARSGQVAVLDFGDELVPLTPALLLQLDMFAVALVRSLDVQVGATTGRTSALALEDDLFADPGSLARYMAEATRRVSRTVGSTASTAAAVVALSAALAGSTPLALAAGGVAATAFMVSTLYGTAVGATLDGGSAALLDGSATWEDFAPSGRFFAEQYVGLAKDALISMLAAVPLGGKLQETLELGGSAIDTYQSLTDLQLLPAFDAGQLDEDGYPPSSFALSVTASASPYLVTVAASPATAGARIRLQVSGTDGYVFNQDAALDGAGRASFSPQPAAEGSGIVDTVNVFDLDGRATASTTVSF